jgi:putative Mg2+ transporter-C (MgtC) family protein
MGNEREKYPLISASSNLDDPNPYFTEYTAHKALLYIVLAAYVISTGLVAAIEPFLNIPCDNPGEVKEYANPAYDGSDCNHIRYRVLLGLTKQECAFGRRLLVSVLLGGLVGWERREADRPAGIRTMSLVSLGSCLFTINSTFAFMDGPNTWDASRISAAIPSGVGFLGAGLIFKKEEKNEEGGTSPVVSGLTTAASLWLSAAVGIACGGDLYFAASFGVAIMMLLLRFGPRGNESEADEDEEEEPFPANAPPIEFALEAQPLETRPSDASYHSIPKKHDGCRKSERFRNRKIPALSTDV